MRSRWILSGLVAAGVLASVAAPAGATPVVRGPRAEPALRVTQHCVVTGPVLDVAWRAPDTALYRLGTDPGGLAPYVRAAQPGWQAQHVQLPVRAGQVTVRLQATDPAGDAVGDPVAQRPVTVPACDAWPELQEYLSSGANAAGAPQSVGALTGRTSQGWRGTTVHEATGGDVVVLPDGTTHVVRGVIADRWRAEGGARGRLLDPETSEVEVADGSGFYSTFQNASIFWSPATGTHVVYGYPYGIGLDGTTWNPGPGYPTDDGGDVQNPDGTHAGSWQHFENAVRYRSMFGAGDVYRGPLLDTYARHGYEKGYLGWPVSDNEPFWYRRDAVNDRDSWRQRFQFGAIYAPLPGKVEPHVVRGAIAAYYQGRDTSDFSLVRRFGYPVTDELSTPDGVGRYNDFANDTSIYWSPATGAHEVVGSGWGFRAYWASRGWERSSLGYPAASELGLPQPNRFGTTGAVQAFSGGNAYLSGGATGQKRFASVVGDLLREYGRLGWETSALGYPVAEETAVPGGTQQLFEGGRLVRDGRTGAVRVDLTPSGA